MLEDASNLNSIEKRRLVDKHCCHLHYPKHCEVSQREHESY